MTIPPSSPKCAASSPLPTEAGPSKPAFSPKNKRAASTSLSDSETLVTITTKTPQTTTRAVKAGFAMFDVHRRKRRRNKFSITKNVVNVSPAASSSVTSLKGKEQEGKADQNNEEPKNDASDTNASDELALLRARLDQQKVLLDAHKAFLNSLSPSLTCQICLDPMYRPYTLAPCGHTACYDCLLAWFRAPPSHIGQPPPPHLTHNFDADDPTLLARDAPMLLRKEKTCPHCRAVVRDTPVEAWGIKDIVHHLFAHKGDVVRELYPSYTRQQEAAQRGASQAGTEAWRGVFKRWYIPGTLAVPNGSERGRAEAINDEEGQEDRGFYDDEDAVYRCTTCYHEIWDGICSSCGRLYPGLHHDLEDEDEDVDPRHWMDAEEFDGFDEGDPMDADDGFGGQDADFRGMMDALGFYRAMNPEHDVEGADEEGYESSFIDDGDEHARIEEYHSAEEAGEFDSGDGAVSDRDEDRRSRRVVPPLVPLADDGPAGEASGQRPAAIELTDSESEASRLPVNARRRRVQASRIHIDSDNDDNDDDDDADSDVHRARQGPQTLRSHRTIVFDSDSEEEEDERSYDGVRRITRFYARSLSDEESLERSLSDNGSDHSSQHEFRGSMSGLSHDNYDNYVFSDEEDINWSD